MNNQKAVGKQIQKYRRKKGLTQEKLAENIGVSTATISGIERGIKTPGLQVFINIANQLQVSADVLLQSELESICISNTDNDVIRRLTQLPLKDRNRIWEIVELLVLQSEQENV